MTQIPKQLNIEKWSVDNVCDWLKGTQQFAKMYVEAFRERGIDGRKLSVIELDDLANLIGPNLNHQLIIFKSINNLIQLKYDLQRDTLHNIIFITSNHAKCVYNYIDKISLCAFPECSSCVRLRNDLIRNSALLAGTYRKLITWLVRLPFTRLKPFELFRDDVNFKMKCFLKLVRKRSNENSYDEMKQILIEIQNLLTNMMDYCETNCEQENGKISVAFNYCYLEKVLIKKSNPDQELGLTLISLVDGIHTIAEIQRQSASDDCSRLNVEDDIIAINNHIVIGWNIYSITNLLHGLFNEKSSVYLLLRKMPKDHLVSIKQQQNKYNNNNNTNNLTADSKRQTLRSNSSSNNHQRKHSFSDLFSEEYLMENSSEEEEDVDEKEEGSVDFNNNNKSETNLNDIAEIGELAKDGQVNTTDGYFQKSKLKKKDKISTTKLAKKGKNRLIKSMQNLLFYDRSRSTSAESLNDANENKTKKSSNKNLALQNNNASRNESPTGKQESTNSGKSDILLSFLTNKKWDLNSTKKSDTPSDTPNLINVKKIDSTKRSKNDSDWPETRSKLHTQTSEESVGSPTITSKPPLNKQRLSKPSSQKPSMQGFLYKRKNPKLSTSNSNLNAGGSLTPANSSPNLNNGPKSNTAAIIINSLNLNSKWKRYWCVMGKDYITFYKTPDDKMPDSFLMLRDFSLLKSSRDNGFIVLDKQKQLEHEFYADSADEYKEWFQILNELNVRTLSDSSTSLSALDESTASSSSLLSSHANSQSVPSTTSLSRKNNLNLNLSTIIDDDVNSTNNNNNNLHSPQLSSNASPTLINTLQYQHSFNSSRESSPGLQLKQHSRDGSPNLIYQFQPDLDAIATTSESDAESALNNKRLSLNKSRSHAALTSALISASTTSAPTKKSDSLTPSPASNGSHFVYDDQITQQYLEHKNQQHRANSLPGSLQSCVGSYVDSSTIKTKNPVDESPPNQPAEQAPTKSISSNQKPLTEPVATPEPELPNVKTMTNNSSTSSISSYSSNISNPPLSIGSTNSNSNASMSSSSHVYSPLNQNQSRPYVATTSSSLAFSLSNKQPMNPNTSGIQATPQVAQQPQHYIVYQNSTPQQTQKSSPNCRKISLQLGSHGVRCIQTDQNQPILVTTLGNQLSNKPYYGHPHQHAHHHVHHQQQQQQQQQQAQQPGSPVVFRTELTILPNNKNASNTVSFNNSKNVNVNMNNNNNNNNNKSK